MFDWILKPFLCLALGMSQVAVEFSGGSATDSVTFGSVPHIANLSSRTFSAWVYPETYSSGSGDMIFALSNTSGGNVLIYLTSSKLLFLQSFTINGAAWVTPENIPTLNTWTHIAITYNNSSVSNDPIIYVNGSAVTITEITAPSGTVKPENGVILDIGNWSTSLTPYSRSFNGKIKDVRVYNRILSAAEVTTLYNGGTPDMDLVTDGLQFQAFVVPTFRLTDFVDATLTSDMKVRDRIYGVVGTPHGSPIGRNP